MALFPTNIFELRIVGTLPGPKPYSNVLHYRVVSVPGPGGLPLGTIATEFANRYFVGLGQEKTATQITSHLHLLKVDSVICAGTRFRGYLYGEEGTFPIILNPGSGSNPLPAPTAVTIRKITSDPSRYGTGALHFGTLPESATGPDGNTIAPATRANIEAGIANLRILQDLASTWQAVMIVASGTRACLDGISLLAASRDVTSFLVATKVGTLGKRRPLPLL